MFSYIGMMAFKINSWVSIPHQGSKTKIRLFCFPFAGGGGASFNTWRRQLPEEIELCPVLLPGRETRLREPLFTELAHMAAATAKGLLPYMDVPFAFFGHSLGALIAFETSRYLRNKEQKLPVHLFISGQRAPHLPDRTPPFRNLSDNEFIQQPRSYGGTPEAVFQNKELIDIFLPILRADFTILETYQFNVESPLNCPITAFGGLCDSRADFLEIEAWREHTIKRFSSHFFPGGHFFLSQHEPVLLQYIANNLNSSWL